MIRSDKLTARNFPSAQEEAAQQAAFDAAFDANPPSAYQLAFTDTDFLLRPELRPVRMQLELLKPELIQQELAGEQERPPGSALLFVQPAPVIHESSIAGIVER